MDEMVPRLHPVDLVDAWHLRYCGRFNAVSTSCPNDRLIVDFSVL